jgi:hypothetical protein
MNIVAFSGGKDSAAMSSKMAEDGEDFALLFTPTGNELPGVSYFVRAFSDRLGRELILPKGPSLQELIDTFGALSNNRQRWCTRMTKILPCIAWLRSHPGSVLCVGLRADEEDRPGMYGDHATYRFPLRELGWGLPEVLAHNASRGIVVPERTDCAWCYDQRLIDWKNLLRKHPEVYAAGEAVEARTGHTFRSPTRDTWPAGLAELRIAFDSGRKVRGEDADAEQTVCRVCRG